MQAILRLDLAGQPRGWLTLQEAISAYARGDVVYGIGDALPPVFGGIQRLTGLRSTLEVQPIIATEGRGQMSGYGDVLGEDGAEAVAEWIWQQAQQGW